MTARGRFERTSAGAVVPPVPAAAAAMDDSNARLARAIGDMAAGDQRACAWLYEVTVARVYGLARRITGTAALAEEVVIDTFHQAWQDAARYDPARGTPLAWLLMMCRSRALDALRSRDPAITHEDPASLVEESVEPRSDPLDLLCAAESGSALHAALATLAPAQRQMIALAFFRGLTHDEIAAHVAMPLGTVKSQIRRGVEVLRRALKPGVGEPS